MRGYGLPRHRDLISPDLVDIRFYGLKSSISRCKSKNGDIKNSFRNSRLKRICRRKWKKLARREGKIRFYGGF